MYRSPLFSWMIQPTEQAFLTLAFIWSELYRCIIGTLNTAYLCKCKHLFCMLTLSDRQTDGRDRTGQGRAGQGRAGQGRQTDRQADRQTDMKGQDRTGQDWETGRQTDKRTDRTRGRADRTGQDKTDRQTDRQTIWCILAYIKVIQTGKHYNAHHFGYSSIKTNRTNRENKQQ